MNKTIMPKEKMSHFRKPGLPFLSGPECNFFSTQFALSKNRQSLLSQALFLFHFGIVVSKLKGKKKKNVCVSGFIPRKNRVGRSD